MTLKDTMARHGIAQRQIAALIGKTQQAVQLKLKGEVRWSAFEALAVTRHIRKRYEPEATVEGLFGRGR